MARSKFPKHSTDVKPAAATTSAVPSSSHNSVEMPEAPLAATVTETRKAETNRPARKPEILKTEARSNIVPINLEDEIRRLAYLLSERRGFEPGHEAEDWVSAEREIRQRYRQQSA
jgi:hypothetical protein